MPVPGSYPSKVTKADFTALASLANTNESGKATVLPAPSGDVTGATDRAAINTVLAAGGKILPRQSGGTYYLDATLKLAPGGNTDVDFGTMKFILVGQHNFLQNAEVTPTTTATDVATTAASSIIVSPTLAAAGAAVGMAVGVPLAGALGGDAAAQPMWLYGIITAVAGNDITLGGNANPTAARVTLAGATGHLFATRATNITVRGGIWDAGTVWGTGYETGPGTRWAAANESSFLRFRRVDGLTVTGSTLKATNFPIAGGWCYGVDPGDCSNVLIDNVTPVGTSTAVNGTGPLKRIIVRNIQGQAQDDMVAFGTVGASYTDTEGDISDVLIDGVMSINSWRCVDLYAGQGSNGAVRPFLNFQVRSCKGACQADAVKFTNYNGTATMSGEVQDVTASFGTFGTGGPYYRVFVSAGQPGIVVLGPFKPGQQIGSAVTLTANQAVTSAFATIATLTVTVPPSGSLVLALDAYAFQQLGGAGLPYFRIVNSGLTTTYDTISGGTLAVNSLSGSFGHRTLVTGLTPGASLSFLLQTATSAGTTATLFAGGNFPTVFRALAAS